MSTGASSGTDHRCSPSLKNKKCKMLQLVLCYVLAGLLYLSFLVSFIITATNRTMKWSPAVVGACDLAEFSFIS